MIVVERECVDSIGFYGGFVHSVVLHMRFLTDSSRFTKNPQLSFNWAMSQLKPVLTEASDFFVGTLNT